MSGHGTARERHLSQSLSGRQTAGGRGTVSNVLFRPITLISLILIGFFAFGALIVLGGFAKDLRKAPPGQATPRSVSAVGYKALTDYLTELGVDVEETRGDRTYFDRENRLAIYTPARPFQRIKRTLDTAGDETHLVILPKWSVRQMRPRAGETGRADWARKTNGKSLFYDTQYRNIIDDLPVVTHHTEPSLNTQVFFASPGDRGFPESYAPDFRHLQYFDLNTSWNDHDDALKILREAELEEERRKRAEAEGREYKPKEKKKKKEAEDSEKKEEELVEEPLPDHEVIMKIDGRAVLIRLDGTQTYVLSEPDLVNTMAFQTQSGAQLANVILSEVIQHAGFPDHGLDFDVSLHGIEANRNIIKLLVTPPFLAATLCLLAAGGLVAWQGFNRFGDPARLRPDYAQGPVSLAETAAEFMEIAGRAHKTGEAYAQLVRQQVAANLGFSDRSSDHLNTLLDAREKRLLINP